VVLDGGVRKFFKERIPHGAYNYILSELRIEYRRGFKNVIRMTPTDFEELLNMVPPFISRMNTSLRQAISASDNLAVILRYLATGDSLGSFDVLVQYIQGIHFYITCISLQCNSNSPTRVC
jgi:hypothetical protein